MNGGERTIGEWINKIRGERVLVYMLPKFKEDISMITGTFVSKVNDIFMNDYIMYDGSGNVMERGKHIVIKSNCWKAIG